MSIFSSYQRGGGFSSRRIRKNPRRKIKFPNPIKKPEFLQTVAIFLVIIFAGFLVVKGIASLNISSFFSILSGAFGRELKSDEKGRTNILLLGAAGEGNEGKALTDSIILVSLNKKSGKATLLSIPRDLYVETQETGGHRINLLYEFGEEKLGEGAGLEFTRKVISEYFDLTLHYAWKIDFEGFEKIVDAVGGVTVNVEKAIDDPEYPKDGTYDYEHFYLPAGLQTLNGKTALKYVRSRHTSSDFDRGRRQQQVLLELKEKALSEGLLGSPAKLKAFYRTLRAHIETNMDLGSMITLAGIASRFSSESVYNFNIHDDPTVQGGFLYTPLRELYGGAFVLIPASDKWNEVRRYTALITEKPEWLRENFKIQVLNGTKEAGLAGEMKIILKRYGFAVPRFGNASAQGIEKTTIFVKNPEIKQALPLLTNLIPAEINETAPQKYLEPQYESDADVILELGQDFVPVFNKLNVFWNVVELKPASLPSDQTPTPAQTSSAPSA